MGRAILVRHGQANFGKWNYDQLSDFGQKQSGFLANALDTLNLKNPHWVVGGMQRHHQTLAPCKVLFPDAKITEDQGLNEYDWQDIVGVAHPKLSNKLAMGAYLLTQKNPQKAFQELIEVAIELWLSGTRDADFKESWPIFRQRTLDAFHRHIDPLADVVYFTSGGPISVVIQHQMGISEANAFDMNWMIVNASMSVFKTRVRNHEHQITLSSFNEQGHLYQNQESYITYR